MLLLSSLRLPKSYLSLSLLVAIFSGQQWLAGGQHQATHVDYVLVCSDNTLLIMKSWLYFLCDID